MIFEWHQQWIDLFKKCAWYDFTIVNLDVEYNKGTEMFHLNLGLIGLNVHVGIPLTN